MTDEDLKKWWPDFAALIIELRRINRSDVAELLINAVQGGATGTEILGRLGLVLRDHCSLRRQFSLSAGRSWDAVARDVFRAFPDQRISYWFARLKDGLFGKFSGA